MKHIISLLTFLTIGVLFLSCGKDVDQFIPDPIDEPDPDPIVGDITNFFKATLDDLTIKTNISCYDQAFVTLPSNNTIVFPYNAFDIDGLAPCGFDTPIELEIIEADSKGEIILIGRPTVSGGKLLESKVEYNIEATYDGKPIKLREGVQIQIVMPDDNPQERMELFYGDTDSEGRFDWRQADGDDNSWNNVNGAEWFLTDSTQNVIQGFGYECFSDSISWINIDIFKDVPDDQKTDVCAELPDIYTNQNTMVFLVFNDFNGVVGLFGDAELEKFCEPYGMVPIGFNVTFIAISEQGEDCYHFAASETVVEENHNEIIDPVKTDFEDIKDFLMSL